jgi:hypothetical protein
MRRAGMYEGRPFDLVITDILRPEFQQREAERAAPCAEVQE